MSTRSFIKSIIFMIPIQLLIFGSNSAWSQSVDYLVKLSEKCNQVGDQAACRQLRQMCESDIPQARWQVQRLEEQMEEYNRLQDAAANERDMVGVSLYAQMKIQIIPELNDWRFKVLMGPELCRWPAETGR